MTTITYKHNSTCFLIEFSGHAGFAESGKDIVCAAVSMLANELLYACEKAAQNGEITALHQVQKEALVRVGFRYVQPHSIEDIITLILDCLKALEKEYHAFVCVQDMHQVQCKVK